MKIGLVVFLLLLLSGIGQLDLLEKEALERVRRMPASSFDVELPGSPFGDWFAQVVGPKAGVVWQLSECGEPSNQPTGGPRDLPACAEADAVLPDGLKVMVAISVGTFRRALLGDPVFRTA